MSQGIVITAPSIDEIYRLKLIDIRGLTLADHPSARPTTDGRLEIGGYATDEAIAILCERGCTTDRACDMTVFETKEHLLERWRQIVVDHEQSTPASSPSPSPAP